MPPTHHTLTTTLRLTTASTPHSTPPSLLRAHVSLPTQPQHRTFLNATSSPAIETSWLTKNSRNHRGGAALAARMSPRAQLVAAEEGLNTWLDTASKPKSTTTQNATSEEAPRPWNVIPTPDTPAPVVPARRGTRTPYANMRDETAGAQRDDTPGLIAFSAFLLLPLAFQLGRYFEGRGAVATATGPVGGGEVDGLDRLGQSGLGGMAQDLLWWSGAQGTTAAGTETKGVPEVVDSRGFWGGSWFWAGTS